LFLIEPLESFPAFSGVNPAPSKAVTILRPAKIFVNIHQRSLRILPDAQFLFHFALFLPPQRSVFYSLFIDFFQKI
jgi:hypothetical protein